MVTAYFDKKKHFLEHVPMLLQNCFEMKFESRKQKLKQEFLGTQENRFIAYPTQIKHSLNPRKTTAYLCILCKMKATFLFHKYVLFFDLYIPPMKLTCDVQENTL